MAAPAVLAAAELRRGDDAMLPPTLLRHPAFTAANTTAGIRNLCTLGTLFVLMLFLQSVQHRSALLAGLTVVPLCAPLAVVAPVGGRITSRFGPPRLPAASGLLVAASGLALLTRSGAQSGYADLLSAFLRWEIGCGLLTPAVVAAAIATAPAERSGLASAVNNTARQMGGAIGIAVAGAVAGQPGDQARFLRGFHAVALGTACLYAAVP
ncbi:MFS transporter, partial [Streptomyces canus]|uniref:MFS transporter n=1 Tax=Streptomyces canus TaxID=58343 RepID=UPI0033B2F02A